MTGESDTTTGAESSSRTLRGRLRSVVGSLVDRIRGGERTDAETDPDPDRRAFLRKTGAAGIAVAAGTAAGTGEAAAAGETCSWSRTTDRYLPFDTGGRFGGWGGADYWDTDAGADKTPVVFVHGNGGDACNWNTIAGYLESEGWTGDELWAISFSEYTTSHPEMKAQLDEFVQKVLSETGEDTVHVVAHSLGVTGVRNWMQDYDRHGWVDTFVGMAGANHGVCVCPGCFDTTLGADYGGILGAGEACQFIAVQCFGIPGHPLYELNLPDETPADGIDYHMTRGIYDPLYWCNVFSPYLAGADNDYFYTDHLGQLDQSEEVKQRLPESDDGGGGSWWGWW